MKPRIHAPARWNPAHGFTLIELMIVVAIVAILASIAYPSYMESVRKGWRAEARTALMEEMQQQERFYTQRARYKMAAIGTDTGSSKYDIAVTACDKQSDAEQCIRVTANLKAGFSDRAVGNIWIQSSGVKGCDGLDASRCWQ